MRAKFTLLNGITGIISQFFIIILGFISRSIFIDCLGSEILGLNGTFTNVLSILSVTELGIGSAITFCLYKPIYDDDKEKIAGIMNLFKKAYVVIGGIILVGAVCVTPFLQYIIKDYTLNLNYIRIIFLLYAFNSTISYFLGYCRILLFASQQNYIVTLTDFAGKVLLQTAQIAVLLWTKNYILYLLLVTINNITANLVIRKFYYQKFDYLKGNNSKIDEESKRTVINTVKYLSISSLISVGVFGTDNLIISSIIGVSISGVYSNYTMIIQNVQTLFTSLLNGVTASLGNMIAEGDNEKINRIFDIFDFAYYLVASFTSISLFILLNPFIGTIWIRKDEFLLPMLTVTVLVINNFMTYKRQPVWQYQNTSGIFKHFLPYSFIELILNLVVSVVAAMKLGLIGVFIGTTVAYIVSWIGQTYVVHKYVLHQNVFKYYFKQLVYFGLTALELGIILFLKSALSFDNSWIQFVYLLVLCAVIPNGMNLLLFYRSKEFTYLKENVLNRLLKKMKRDKIEERE